MQICGLAGVIIRCIRSRASYLSALILLLALFPCLSFAQPSASVAAPVTEPIEVGIMCDLTKTTTNLDMISIRLPNNIDEKILYDIAGVLGSKFRAQPQNISIQKGDPQTITDPGVAIYMLLPVVPRGTSGVLPLSPFIETLAHYNARIDLVYIISGKFTYNGYEQYEDKDIKVEFPTPKITDGPEPVAFYGANITIYNQQLVTSKIPDVKNQPVKKSNWLWTLIFGILIAGITGA
ncbi:MAG: hypothetical protein WCJ56_07845, partial [bacterium]